MITTMALAVDLDRDEAREIARRELSQPGYERDVSWPARVLEWLLEQLNRLVSSAAEAIPGGLGVLLLLAAVLAVLIIALVRAGPLRRKAHADRDPVFAERRMSARDHRSAAEAAAAAGDWSRATVERFRAIVATLEERGFVEERSGRTAAEIARHAGQRLPALRDALPAAADVFDRIRYGGQPAGSADHDTVRQLDDAVQNARADEGQASSGPALAVPR